MRREKKSIIDQQFYKEYIEHKRRHYYVIIIKINSIYTINYKKILFKKKSFETKFLEIG